MKNCSKCNGRKSLSEFPVRKRCKDGHSGICKTCTRTYNNSYYRTKEGRKGQIVKANGKAIQANQDKLYLYLKDKSCVDCGEKDPIVLEFDHLDPTSKTKNVSTMMSSAYSWKRILSEIQKCDVVCANCHRKRTASTYGFWKLGRDSSMVE